MRRKPDNFFAERYPLLHRARDFNQTGNWASLTPCDVERVRYDEKLKAAEDWLPRGTLYLNSALHDARVTSITWGGGIATLWFNEYQTHCFCHALGDSYGEKALNWETVFPLGIRYHGVTKFSAARISKSYKILPISASDNLPRVYDLWYDEARRLEPGHIETAWLFGQARKKGNKVEILLEISAARIEFIEQQRATFQTLLGGRYLDLYDAYWAARCSGKWFDYSSSRDFIREWKGGDGEGANTV